VGDDSVLESERRDLSDFVEEFARQRRMERAREIIKGLEWKRRVKALFRGFYTFRDYESPGKYSTRKKRGGMQELNVTRITSNQSMETTPPRRRSPEDEMGVFTRGSPWEGEMTSRFGEDYSDVGADKTVRSDNSYFIDPEKHYKQLKSVDRKGDTNRRDPRIEYSPVHFGSTKYDHLNNSKVLKDIQIIGQRQRMIHMKDTIVLLKPQSRSKRAKFIYFKGQKKQAHHD